MIRDVRHCFEQVAHPPVVEVQADHEAAVALALAVAIYKHRETVNIDEIDLLRW